MFINDIPQEYRQYGPGVAHLLMYLRYNKPELESWFLVNLSSFVNVAVLSETPGAVYPALNSFWRYHLTMLTNTKQVDTYQARLSLRDDILNNTQNWLYNFEVNIFPLVRDNIEYFIPTRSE